MSTLKTGKHKLQMTGLDGKPLANSWIKVKGINVNILLPVWTRGSLSGPSGVACFSAAHKPLRIIPGDTLGYTLALCDTFHNVNILCCPFR